jgi:hypothetical protein
VATEGFVGIYMETRNYGATAAFWESLGFKNDFETDHQSGQWRHPSGGPYVFIAERQGSEPLTTYPMLWVADADAFAPARPLDYAEEFKPEHWGVLAAIVRDPDGRQVGLQAPMPEGMTAPSMEDHHADAHH